METSLRRTDRKLDDRAAMALLQRGTYGILSTSDAHNRPYGIPVNYVVREKTIFFHCAVEGRKLANIAANQTVSFCVVGETEVIPENFATRYESVVLSGKANRVEDRGSKREALRALVEKYAPDHSVAGDAYIEKLLDKTVVVQIRIEELIGKASK